MNTLLECETPRYLAQTRGIESLSDVELLSLLLPDTHEDKIGRARAQLARYKTMSAVANSGTLEFSAAMELARRALRERMASGNALTSPHAVRDYLRLKLQDVPHEVFLCVFLDAQNRVLEVEELFRGTLTQTSVYPREVVKRALAHNCAGVIFAHNHPSGVAEPSRSDESLTLALKQALALVDVKTLDHFVIGAGTAMSFAERGLI
jgi:DNA repair protein RadC